MADFTIADALAANVGEVPVILPGDPRRKKFASRLVWPTEPTLKLGAGVAKGGEDAITMADPRVVPPVEAAPIAPAVVAAPGVAVAAPAPIAVPTVAPLTGEAIPGVSPLGTRPIEELQSISSMLAPDVEAQPLTRAQLTGGDVFGLTPEQVHNVTATRTAQLGAKALSDKAALDFLRESTGVKTAEKLVTDKIQEEGAIGRTKFAAESSAAESAKARNRSILLEQWKAKTDLANRLMVTRAKAAAEATTAKPVDMWKAKKSAIMLEFAKTNPLAAAGLTRIPDIDDALTKLEQDKVLKEGNPLKMTPEVHKFYSQLVSLGVPPSDVELEEEF